MKSSAISFGRWIGLAGLLFAFSGVEPHYAIAQELVSFGNISRQQPSPSVSSVMPPETTPELEADMLSAHRQYMDAISAYKKIRPQTAEIYNKIGLAYQRLSMLGDAKFNYEQALKMDSNLAPAYNNLGTIYFHENNNKKAERFYKRSLKLDAKMAPFWSNLGGVYMARKMYSDGAEAYQRAFALDSDIFQELALNGIREQSSEEDLAKMYLCFAEIYAQAGMKDQAVDYLRKALLLGFNDRQKLQRDQMLAGLHGDPGYEKLFPTEPKK
jgi:tetratricopeptide (TPR) repeat protein